MRADPYRLEEAMVMAVTAKLTGTIKTLKRAEGYGFITHAATGEDHFFHRTSVDRSVQTSWDELNVGDPVEFIPVEGPKGPRAIEVRPVL